MGMFIFLFLEHIKIRQIPKRQHLVARQHLVGKTHPTKFNHSQTGAELGVVGYKI